MSVSALNSSMVGNMFSSDPALMNGTGNTGSASDFANSIISDNDSDSDGVLSLEESGIKEDHFNNIDSDSDGLISQEEIVADMEKMQQQMAMMGQMSVMMQGGDSSGSNSLIDSLMEELDSDGDSLISQEESGLEDELFSVLDSDSDGNLSSEELQANMRPPEGMMPPEGMVNAAGSVSGSSESSSSSEEAEEEYDEYDYNQDGVVTFDELQQAFAGGDTSLEDIVGKSSNMNQSAQREGGESGQSILQRMAMRAYGEQASTTYDNQSLGAFA